MSKYRFSRLQRYVIWKHFAKECYLCKEPLRLQDVTIDHIIPESLLGKPGESVVMCQLGLPSSFQINSYSNWMPAHNYCNQLKAQRSFDPSPNISLLLQKLREDAPKVELTVRRMEADQKVDELIGKLLVAKETGALSADEIRALFAEPSVNQNLDVQSVIQDLCLQINLERWSVVSQDDSIVVLSDGRMSGVTSSQAVPDWSWICPSCGRAGPWSGARCLNCGALSDPND